VLALIVLLCSLVLLPKSFSHDPNGRHIGIAQSIPIVATYTIVLLALAYVLLLRALYRPRGSSLPVSVFIFFAFLVVAFCSIWSGTNEQLAGALQLTLGFTAWFIGAQLGPIVLGQNRRVRWFAGTIVGLVGIETLVALLVEEALKRGQPCAHESRTRTGAET